MSSLPNRARRVKPARTCRILERLPGGKLLLAITEGKKTQRYWVRPIPSDLGPAFRWQKWVEDGGQCYDVCLGCEPHEPARCDCPGHEHHGHRLACRHIACSRALLSRGELPS